VAILGFNTKGPNGTSFAAGMMMTSKWTLATAGTLQELHGWFAGSGTTCRIVIYANTAGAPSTRVAYTAPLSLTGVDVELSETGFSVPLAAGVYWIGFRSAAAGSSGQAYMDISGDTHAGVVSGAADPPDNPFPAPGSSGTRNYSCWAVVGAAAPTGPSILARKAGAQAVDSDDWAALVDAVVALGGAVTTRKAGSGAVGVASYNAVVDAVVALGGSVATRKAGSGDVDPVSYNALVDAVKLLGAP
jgi:hypothetical protein